MNVHIDGKELLFPIFFYIITNLFPGQLNRRMSIKIRTIYKGREKDTFLTESGSLIKPPADWSLLLPGDAALTRAVKKATIFWKIEIKKGRRIFSGGIFASDVIIRKITQELEENRNTPEYLKKREYALERRKHIQDEYVNSFQTAVIKYLSFHPKYHDLAIKLAEAVTEHATPVGSGTVARTKTIPVENRVEAAVVAWMRHKTTGYDTMKIKRIKGERRRIRRELASASKSILARYRAGELIDSKNCPLQKSL